MKNNIKVHRAIYNLTQAELATKLGVSRQTINTIETGRFIPSTVLALKLAKIFRVTVEEIFLLENSD
jgi:putative transcriptional regulator